MKNNILIILILFSLSVFAGNIGFNKENNIGFSFTSDIPATPKYTLTVNIVGSGTVTINPQAVSYDSGTSVTVSALPNVGYKFTGYNGDTTTTQSNVTFVLKGNKTITANFPYDTLKPLYARNQRGDTLSYWGDTISVYFNNNDVYIDTIKVDDIKANIIDSTDTVKFILPDSISLGCKDFTFSDNISPCTLHCAINIIDYVYIPVLSLIIDSIRPNPWYYGKLTDVWGQNFGSSSGKLVLATDTLVTSLWENLHIQFTIPSNSTRGKKPLTVINSNNDSATDTLRVLRPYQK